MFPPDSFRAARWVRTCNLVLQAILFLTLFSGLNYVAQNHAWRFDLTRHRKFSLSPETLSYVKSLQRPVDIVVTLSEENDNPEVRGLLNEYAYASATNPAGLIKIEFVDIYRDRRRAEELGIGQSDVIVLICGDNRSALTIDDLYQIKNKQRDAFHGEQAVTEAILNVSNPERQKVYFLVGHGEMRPDDTDAARGLSMLRDQLRVRNFQVHTLELAVARKIPTDAALLVATAPQTSYTRAEQEMLRQYLSASAGRLILLLPPAPNAAQPQLGLDDLLLDWGILVDDDMIFDPAPESRTDDGDTIIRHLEVKHPITQTLVNNQFPLRLSAARSVRRDPGLSAGSGLTVVTLAAAAPTAWGEVGYRTGRMPTFDAGVDIRPIPGMEKQLGVIVASERVSVRGDLPFSVPGGRLVVFGTGDLVSNLRIANVGNLPIFLGAVNWSVDRDRQLNIPPRPIERFHLALSAADFMKLRYALLLVLPASAMILGLLVYWTRRT